MKSAFYKYLKVSLLVLSLTTLQAKAEVIRLSEPIERDSNGETFGNRLTNYQNATLGTLLSNPDSHLGKDRTVKAKVAKVCRKKGCFFIAYDGQYSVRVSFENYAFFVPTDIANRNVIMNAKLVSKNLSEKKADHFNKDLGIEEPADAIQSGAVLELVATSVRIES